MSKTNITENTNKLTKTCSILLTVIFFILSFLTGFNNIATFVLGILALGIVILLSYKDLKNNNYYALGILLIPILSYGVINSLSYFSSAIYSLSTRIFLTINMLLFTGAGYLSKNIKNFDFKWIFKGIFISLSIICLINVISTSVYFGPLYGFIIPNYSAYYDGAEARLSVASTAYALCGFSIKQVPIEYYLLFPMLLLTSFFLYLFEDRKNKINIISTCCFCLIGLISLLFVISKAALIFMLFYCVFYIVITLLILVKKLYGKTFRYALYALSGLFAVFAIFFFINAQYDLTQFRSFMSSNRLLNYVFNTNRYSDNARVVLNGALTKGKIIGFPSYYDYQYLSVCLPSNNTLVNQFMYGGIFGFLFYLLIIAIFIYQFIKLKKFDIKDKAYKYFPLLFVVTYFVISMICDQNSYDLFNIDLVLASYLSPFFYISLFIIGHYNSLINKEYKNEKE